MKLNSTIKAGQALGIIGGIIAVIGLVLYLDLEGDGAMDSLGTAALMLLVMCLSFALAGAFGMHGQWNWNLLMFMNFLTLGVIAGATAAQYFELWFGCVEFVCIALICVISYSKDGKLWTAEPHEA
ncbi:MAG: hypothetical protein LKJ94_04255 [Candidatus Methanomethylophilus sp.]|jgi:uncharacterized membrane protein YfcA|nr:hypothetical protein [Methanomethylophilus sp.]MCI2074900.1 hypothetical protein [Methanomethylophilus sp.]MCI2093588.1 hypothetical protein [Methanomethylophilus sp.]TQS76691.1 MAG: hypothetical protein A3Q59_02075 [Methanomethylophilus alvi]WII08672.1 hypothetical protein O8W32_05735 [Methanomassiliicoccales archaeon LGM-DZ1]